MSGWLALSRRFRQRSEPYGDVRSAEPHFCTVRMRFETRNIVSITAEKEGLYLYVFFFFRIGHPPLLMPWGEIQMRRAKYLWFRQVFLTLGNEEQIPMRMSEHLARKLGILERIPDSAQALPSSTS
jgi:hypothetical protein